MITGSNGQWPQTTHRVACVYSCGKRAQNRQGSRHNNKRERERERERSTVGYGRKGGKH